MTRGSRRSVPGSPLRRWREAEQLDFQKIEYHSRPLLDQPAVLVIMALLFVVLAWRVFGRPRPAGWSLTRRIK